MPPNALERSGKGRELQFFALDEEVDAWLGSYLPEQFAPYCLCGFDRIRHGTHFEWQKFRSDDVSVRNCQAEAPGRTQVWVASLKLSGVRVDELTSEREFATAGFILLQHGSERRGQRDASRIALVDKVVRVGTGEVIVHREYQAIFSSLAKGIRAHLGYATKLPGTGVEDAKVALMTDAAARASLEGRVVFTREPGHRLA